MFLIACCQGLFIDGIYTDDLTVLLSFIALSNPEPSSASSLSLRDRNVKAIVGSLLIESLCSVVLFSLCVNMVIIIMINSVLVLYLVVVAAVLYIY